jgi:hypothetical protein
VNSVALGIALAAAAAVLALRRRGEDDPGETRVADDFDDFDDFDLVLEPAGASSDARE